MTALTATEPIIRARLKKATDKQYAHGVLGLRAKPDWDGASFDHEGTPVTVTLPGLRALHGFVRLGAPKVALPFQLPARGLCLSRPQF